jgi:cell division transport system permease protein
MVKLLYIFKRIATGTKLRPWGSLLTLIACWFAVFQLCVVLYTITVANRAALMPGTNSTVMAYLQGRPQQAVIQAIQEKISLINGVSDVSFIPHGQGFERMKQWLGSDSPLIDGLDAEILPDAFEIKIRPQYAGEIESLVKHLRDIPNIEDVRYHKGLIGYIAGAYHTILLAGIFVALVVIVCLGLVIFLSVRVGIMTRSREVEVLNILGAGKTFLFAPYVIEAALYGIVGSMLALITAQGSIGYIISHLPVLYGIVSPMNIHHVIAMIVFACLCSISGAVLAIKRSIDA